LIEKTRHSPTWQNLRGLVASQAQEKEAQAWVSRTQLQADKPSANRWRAFFESPERPTEDFMQERVDLPPQTREIF
jgi:hypothetical protein